jgi:hypothetical protein
MMGLDTNIGIKLTVGKFGLPMPSPRGGSMAAHVERLGF